MPLTLYPVFKPALLVPEFAGQGEILLAELEALDNLADQHGLTRLSAFADTRSSLAGLDVSAQEARRLPPCESWFECSQGRIACERLAHLAASVSQDKPAKGSHQRGAIAVLALARILGAVQAADVQFRLEILWVDGARAVTSAGNYCDSPPGSITAL